MFESVLKRLLRAVLEASVDRGVADATSTVNFLDDSSKSWPPSPGGFENLLVEITEGTGDGQFAKIASNTATRLTFAAAMPVAPDATSKYRIGFFGKMASDITAWGGTALTGRDISLDLAKLGLQRWGRDLEPEWVHAAEVADSAEGAALVTKAVGAGKSGYIYGFLISAQETNDFKLNWTSGETPYSIRIPFGGAGSTECVDPTPLNEGLPADAGTNITITNVNAAAAGKIYQARLLYAEV